MTRALTLAVLCAALVLASAGTSAADPSLALTATPARVTLHGSGQAVVQLRNTGITPVVVDVARAGFRLDLRGRPRVAAPGARTPRLAFLPRRLAIAPKTSAPLTISARLPRRAEPGDHDALVLLTTRPQRRGNVAVRMRLGIVVVVRAPGTVARRLELRQLRVRRAGRTRILDLLVVNRGNVTETIRRNVLTLTLRRKGRAVRLRPTPRTLRPRSRGIVEFRYRGSLRGAIVARATVALEGGAAARRLYRIRL